MERDDEPVSNCPFLMPRVSERSDVLASASYCRLPNGRARVPTRDQITGLCTDRQYHDCAGYRRWKLFDRRSEPPGLEN